MIVSLAASAVRRWLVEHDELPDQPLVALVPVSVRSEEQQGTYGNRVGTMSVPLFTNEPDPVARLRLTHEALRSAKERHKALPAQLLQDATQFIPPAVFARASDVLAGRDSHPGVEPCRLQRARTAAPALLLGRAGAGDLSRVGDHRRDGAATSPS